MADSIGHHEVPNSAGTSPPRLTAPAGACDAHLHIIDERFRTADHHAPLPPGATVADYRRLQRRIGTTRAVIVQPRILGTDNRCTLDAITQLGGGARGIAVVHPTVSDDELRRLDAGGIRGLRFSVWKASDAVTSIDMIAPLARRIAPLGWHVQLHMSGDQIAEQAALLEALPTAMVIDHAGRLPPGSIEHPALAVMLRLLERGRTWVKLSGAYLNTASGPPYADASVVARALARAAPERMVWGSDWPHITERVKPDDAQLLDLLADWVPDAAMRQRVLVDNPAALYGFA